MSQQPPYPRTTGPHEYPPVGRCIYCGARRYSPDRDKLAEEHIIPDALGGNLVLPLACCAQCEGKIGWFEQFCLRQMLGPLRYQEGLGRRRKKDRPTTLPMEFSVGGNWETRQIPLADTPTFLILPFLKMPGILEGEIPDNRSLIFDFWQGTPTKDRWEEVRARHGGGVEKMRTHTVRIDEARFVLFIAKIAHGFATVHRNSFENFVALLPDLILRRPLRWPPAYLIGGEPEVEEKDAATHSLQISREETLIGEVAVVRVRLFGNNGTPTYLAVTGASPAAYHRMNELIEGK